MDPFLPQQVISVSVLNRLARAALQERFPLLWVAGEISSLTRAASGHVYFTLKDEAAQVRCAMFRNRAQALPWRAENGQQVEVQALVTLYEPRGDYQLTVETMRRAGLGKLYEAFARLRQKLDDEGLFAADRKRPLPRFPTRIGIVTSASGAALHDIVSVFARRAPQLHLILFPTQVQGEAAPAQICAAIRAADSRKDLDVLIVARGGGSMEDLWAFNDEGLARAVAAASLPVVSGVGHETDVSICDFVADVRAATPTAAAELITAEWVRATEQLASLGAALRTHARKGIEAKMQRADLLARGLLHPGERLKRLRQTLALCASRLAASARRTLGERGERLAQARLRLNRRRVDTAPLGGQLALLGQRLHAATRRDTEERRHALEQWATALSHLNPHATLARGYSIVRDARGNIVRSGGQVAPGDLLDLRFASGGATAGVVEVKP
jgi:exodeoxyribonuclease VII large subunit